MVVVVAVVVEEDEEDEEEEEEEEEEDEKEEEDEVEVGSKKGAIVDSGDNFRIELEMALLNVLGLNCRAFAKEILSNINQGSCFSKLSMQCFCI